MNFDGKRVCLEFGLLPIKVKSELKKKLEDAGATIVLGATRCEILVACEDRIQANTIKVRECIRLNIPIVYTSQLDGILNHSNPNDVALKSSSEDFSMKTRMDSKKDVTSRQRLSKDKDELSSSKELTTKSIQESLKTYEKTHEGESLRPLAATNKVENTGTSWKTSYDTDIDASCNNLRKDSWNDRFNFDKPENCNQFEVASTLESSILEDIYSTQLKEHVEIGDEPSSSTSYVEEIIKSDEVDCSSETKRLDESLQDILIHDAPIAKEKWSPSWCEHEGKDDEDEGDAFISTLFDEENHLSWNPSYEKSKPASSLESTSSEEISLGDLLWPDPYEEDYPVENYNHQTSSRVDGDRVYEKDETDWSLECPAWIMEPDGGDTVDTTVKPSVSDCNIETDDDTVDTSAKPDDWDWSMETTGEETVDKSAKPDDWDWIMGLDVDDTVDTNVKPNVLDKSMESTGEDTAEKHVNLSTSDWSLESTVKTTSNSTVNPIDNVSIVELSVDDSTPAPIEWKLVPFNKGKPFKRVKSKEREDAEKLQKLKLTNPVKAFGFSFSDIASGKKNTVEKIIPRSHAGFKVFVSGFKFEDIRIRGKDIPTQTLFFTDLLKKIKRSNWKKELKNMELQKWDEKKISIHLKERAEEIKRMFQIFGAIESIDDQLVEKGYMFIIFETKASAAACVKGGSKAGSRTSIIKNLATLPDARLEHAPVTNDFYVRWPKYYSKLLAKREKVKKAKKKGKGEENKEGK